MPAGNRGLDFGSILSIVFRQPSFLQGGIPPLWRKDAGIQGLGFGSTLNACSKPLVSDLDSGPLLMLAPSLCFLQSSSFWGTIPPAWRQDAGIRGLECVPDAAIVLVSSDDIVFVLLIMSSARARTCVCVCVCVCERESRHCVCMHTHVIHKQDSLTHLIAHLLTRSQPSVYHTSKTHSLN